MKFRSCEIAPKQVRLLLFKECDWRGRKVLFDSSTIEKIPSLKNDKPDKHQKNEVPCIVEVSDGFTYVYKGAAADASLLGDMIFGAVAMNYKNVSLKIHIMDDPKRFMCTKVFCVPTKRTSRVDSKSSDANSGPNASKPLDVPALREEGVSLSFSIDRGDSGFYGEQSPYSSVGSSFDYYSMLDAGDGTQDEISFHSPTGRKLSTSSRGSWQRRTFQNLATRFDLGQSSNLLEVPTSTATLDSSDSQLYSNSTASRTTDSLLSASSAVAPRRNKLGLALLITVPDSSDKDFIRRCVEHSPQLQALVCRLRLATLSAGTGGNFVSTLHKAALDAARWLSDLMYGPRLQSAWLGLVAGEARISGKLCERLLSDLCAVLAAADTKHTNFFISTLLTNVLTHHLGWVTTVSPYDVVDPQESRTEPPDFRRPYNALWAQLGDLCGSIGYPPKTARTIIAGASNAQFINRLLAVLTYFVRCGDVTRTDFLYKDSGCLESRAVSVKPSRNTSLTRSETCRSRLGHHKSGLNVPPINTQSAGSSATLVPSEVSLKRSTTLSNLNDTLSISSEPVECGEKAGQLRRNPTILISSKASPDTSWSSSGSVEMDPEKRVVFVLGDDEKLVGLKNKSNGGKSVKRSSRVHNEPVPSEPERRQDPNKQPCDLNRSCNAENPSKCCRQTLQHSKPIKHSGFKFEFDKYPQIVTNYMKSKNLEILDRHYIGKPGNLKLDNFQFDPTVVPLIQEERCEICYKCQLMESMLQTPTNASEMEFMNDVPRHAEPQYAKETVAHEQREMSPKTFVRKRKENTVVVNLKAGAYGPNAASASMRREKPKDVCEVRTVLEFPLPSLCRRAHDGAMRSGFDASLLGGVTEHYIPDLILQGTIANPETWETELRRDLNLTTYLNKTLETPMQAVAIVGDTNTWEVRVIGRDCGWGGLSPLVGGMLDALPIMRRAKVPAYQCVLYLEGKLRELCVLSKTLAELLMSTDFCDMAALTKALGIDANDVPLLLAVATTHTPQLAARYGISYRNN
ncbi:unnamed protein product, partial [Iphiclides podalirius]